MAGLSRSKNGVASLAYGAGHPRLARGHQKYVDARDKRGHDDGETDANRLENALAPVLSSASSA